MVKPKKPRKQGKTNCTGEALYNSATLLPVYVMVANLPFATLLHTEARSWGNVFLCCESSSSTVVATASTCLTCLLQGQEKAVATTRQVMCAVDRSVVVQ